MKIKRQRFLDFLYKLFFGKNKNQNVFSKLILDGIFVFFIFFLLFFAIVFFLLIFQFVFSGFYFSNLTGSFLTIDKKYILYDFFRHILRIPELFYNGIFVFYRNKEEAQEFVEKFINFRVFLSEPSYFSLFKIFYLMFLAFIFFVLGYNASHFTFFNSDYDFDTFDVSDHPRENEGLESTYGEHILSFYEQMDPTEDEDLGRSIFDTMINLNDDLKFKFIDFNALLQSNKSLVRRLHRRQRNMGDNFLVPQKEKTFNFYKRTKTEDFLEKLYFRANLPWSKRVIGFNKKEIFRHYVNYKYLNIELPLNVQSLLVFKNEDGDDISIAEESSDNPNFITKQEYLLETYLMEQYEDLIAYDNFITRILDDEEETYILMQRNSTAYHYPSTEYDFFLFFKYSLINPFVYFFFSIIPYSFVDIMLSQKNSGYSIYNIFRSILYFPVAFYLVSLQNRIFLFFVILCITLLLLNFSGYFFFCIFFLI